MKYKNITKTDLYIPNVGLVKAGEVVETEIQINNQNFELVVEKKSEATAQVKIENNK